MTNSSKQTNLEFLITVPPKEFVAGFISILNEIADEGHGIHNYWATPLDHFMYQTRKLLIKYLIKRESNDDKDLQSRIKPDFHGEMHFVVANWLDWNGIYNVHERYKSDLDFRNNTGLVLKYPTAVLAAAAILDDNLFVDVMYTVPAEVLEDIYATVTGQVNTAYSSRYSQDAINTGISRAKARFEMLLEN